MITLAPLAPHQITKPKTKEELEGGQMLLSFLEPTLLASHCELRTLQEIILFTPSQNRTKTPLHSLASHLLQEFSYAFPEEIPSGLPPQRSIQHHIDLISKAILPNKPT